MSKAQEFVEFLASLEKRWRIFAALNSAKENFDENDITEFNELVKMTLMAHLDFRITIISNPEIERIWSSVKIIISTLQLKDELNHSLNIALNTDKWDSNFGSTLLQGRLIGNATKSYILEKKLQSESDDVIKARLKTLIHLLLNTKNDEDTGQIILNVYESYRKMLLRDVQFQCKFSSEAIETLLKNYLIILCHRKQFEHLSSAIKLYPVHRKFKFVCDLINGLNVGACHAHIAEGFLEDLLQREFKKDKSRQDIRNLSLYISKIIDIASNEKIARYFNLEKLVLSANTEEVISDYYYLVATQLRFRMPNKFTELVLKLISIGLSLDLSNIERLKYYAKEQQKIRCNDFKKTYYRMYLALVTLGYMIPNYSLRRLCFEAAKVCEPDTHYCAKFLESLPEINDNDDEDNLNPILQDIRYQLEIFQHDIRSNNSLPSNFEKNSNIIYERLIYFNQSISLPDDLKPLEYPGVEKYLKKQAIEDQEHISQASDLDKCLHEIDNFNADLSIRFKKMRNFFKSSVLPLKKQQPPTHEKVQQMCMEFFSLSESFKIIKERGLFAEMFDSNLKDILVETYESYKERTIIPKSEENNENFLFDFDANDTIWKSEEYNIDSLYLEGRIPVRILFNKGLATHDIENVLLYAILEKKMRHIPAEFEYFNKNRNVEIEENQNQVHAGLIYLLNRPHPEYARLMRLSSALMRFGNVMEYILGNYIIDAAPGKFKYKLKNAKMVKPKSTTNLDSSQISNDTETSDANSNQINENNPIDAASYSNLIKVEKPLQVIKKQISEMIVNKNKKPKPIPTVVLNGNETFNVSNDILNVFYNIRRELSNLTGKEVFLDLNKLSDVTSNNLVHCLQPVESKLEIKVGRIRNGHVDPRDKRVEFNMPLSVQGKLVVTNEIKDEIEYDEFYDNPRIKSNSFYRLGGLLTVESLSHSVKFDLDCRIDNVPSKIKFVFQGMKSNKPRKKPVKSLNDPQQTTQNGNPTKIITATTSVAQQTPDTFIQQSNSNNLQNISPATSNTVMVAASIIQTSLNSHSDIYSNSQSCLPSFGTISQSHYSPQVTHQFTSNLPLQYSITTPQINGGPNSNTSVIQVANHKSPVMVSSQNITNGVNFVAQPMVTIRANPPQQQFAINYEVSKIQNTNQLITPQRPKPKFEILKVEDVSPHIVEARKLSFANPAVLVEEKPSTNGLKTSEIKNECKKVDDQIDFEAVIQNSAVIPKKIVQQPQENQSNLMKKLLSSPPPLHYPSPDLTVLPKSQPITFKCEQLALTIEQQIKPEQKEQKIAQSTIESEKPEVKAPILSHKLTSNVIMKKADVKVDFIDLTDDNDDINKKNLDIQFVSCDSEPEFICISSPISDKPKERKRRIGPSGRKFKSAKRPLLIEDEEQDEFNSKQLRRCSVQLPDIMQNFKDKTLKKETMIELKHCQIGISLENRALDMLQNEIKIEEVPSEELPIEDYAETLFDTTFTIVCQSSVSFLFHTADDYRGDGTIANTCNNRNNSINSVRSNECSTTKITNDINEIVNKFRKLNYNNSSIIRVSDSISIDNVRKNLQKNLYSEKNHLNFTKNLKNRKKFIEWTPKVSNCSNFKDVKKSYKEPLFDHEKNHKSLLYQVSHAVINSIPGMNSMEFFKMPSPFRRSLQIEVVHLKDMKLTSNESSDVNDGASNEPTNLHHNETIPISNSDLLLNNSTATTTTIHIQKIGQTSISHETETRTLQTSFGSIIKNTYPPATSRMLSSEKEKLLLKIKQQQDETNVKKISIGESSLKGNQNVKIIACTSSQQQQQQQDLLKSANKNQTLINMLTQQVMVPTNSNRHFIITSAPKSTEIKQETGTSCTLTSSSSAAASTNVRKTISNAVGQSQLVQILNSPPSNFTMKSLNVITSSSGNTISATKPNQVVTVTSSQSQLPSISSHIEGLKTDLPNSLKQQGIVQFICKTDGKIIHLTPICSKNSAGGVTKKITYKVDTTGAKGPTILHHANQQIILNSQLRKDENPNILTIIQKQGDSTALSDNKKPNNKNTIVGITSAQSNATSPICTRSIYEENYAKFIQTPSSSNASNPSDMGLLTISSSPISSASSSPSCSTATTTNTFIQKIGKTVIQSSNQILPKFNQAFGKSIFSSNSSLSEQMKSHKVTATTTTLANRETITRSIMNSISPVTKITTKTEQLKANDGSLLNFIEHESIEKPITPTALPTLQTALQGGGGSNLLYARPIGNGKLIASNNNNVLLTALRNSSNSGNNSVTNNVRILTSLPDSMTAAAATGGNNHRTIMTPVRISVPIQIPQLINSVRPQPPGNFRSQIVIATTPTSSSSSSPSSSTLSNAISTHTALIRPQTSIQAQTGSKLQSLLMGAQSSPTIICSSSSPSSSIQTIATTNNSSNQDVEIEVTKAAKTDQKPLKKSVDNSTLEQLREFDMVLEQVLERSSVTPNSVSSPPPPPRPDSANRSSPRKHISENIAVKKIEIKSSSVSCASNSPNDSPTSSKSLSSNSAKAPTPKLQEDEHTAQRILDILANYKEQVRNSPDLNNKPAPRRRANPPTNPPAKRKKVTTTATSSGSSGSMKNSKQFGSSSDVMTDNTMGSEEEEDSSCGVGSGVASTGSMNNSPRGGDIDDHTDDASMDNNFYMEDTKREIALSPQSSSSSSMATSPAHNKFSLNRRLLVTESKNANNSGISNSPSIVDSNSSKSRLIISNSQSSTSNASSATRASSSSIGESIERLSAQGSTATAVLMPGNYILPMNMLKSGQHLAILSSNNGQKIIAVPASQLGSSTSASGGSGTSIILQRYVNQINENANMGHNKMTLNSQKDESNESKKTLRLQQNVSIIGNNKNQQTTYYVKPIESIKQEIKSETLETKPQSSATSSFVSDKTLITEIIKQQQQLSHNHPQHNFMIKLNENSDPRSTSSSSIMFMADGASDNKNFEMNNFKIKTEKIDFDGCIKEEIVDLNNDQDLLNSPMLTTTKMEVDDEENTNLNHEVSDIDNNGGELATHHQKLTKFPSILSSCLAKQSSVSNSPGTTSAVISKNSSKGFLIDPSSKILMYNDRKQNSIVDKEIFNPKSFSEECADLGVDEPIASDLFPEADLLFDSGSPKFDQINAHDGAGAIQIKRELENGEVLLQMNYNHNITEPWLNCFDTEDELVDDSHGGESGDDDVAKNSEILKASNHFQIN